MSDAPASNGRSWTRWGSAILFVLLLASIVIPAWRELSTPESWSYWRDLYVAPSLSARKVVSSSIDGLGTRNVLAVSGTIGAAAASWFREQVDQAGLSPGDVVLLSSPGGNVGQAIIMGEIVRARGLTTAVGTADASGRISPSSCASACVFVLAGGQSRLGIAGSRIGVHRFTATTEVADPIADAQRTTGMILGYLSRMGIASSLVEAMSATAQIRWLEPREAESMKLVTAAARLR